jgi:hypothetical protein
MNTNTETGHARNLAIFESLLSFCNGLGAVYNPANEVLQQSSLNTLMQTARTSLETVRTTEAAFDRATNERSVAFKDLRPFATRLVNALEACGALAKNVASARQINRKLQGQRAKTIVATPPQPTEAQVEKNISVSQQSFDNQAHQLQQLIELLRLEPKYTPNETELTITGLQAKLAVLQAANTKVINSYTAWSNSRLQRNNLMYNPVTGLVPTALAVKKYVKSVFGATSAQFLQISGLELRRL